MLNQKEKYEPLIFDVIRFEAADIITTSNVDEWLDEDLDAEWGD